MFLIVNTQTLRFPMTAPEVMEEVLAAAAAMDPPVSVSFASPFELPDGYAWVEEAFSPEYNPRTHKCTTRAEEEAGSWFQVWDVVPLSQPEAATVRAAHAAALPGEVVAAVQVRLDNKARERGYDGILSLCTYVGSSIPKFNAEAQAGLNWRDGHWAKCYEILSEVEAGNRPLPTLAEAMAEMPAMNWPS